MAENDLKVIEAEYSELGSLQPFTHAKFGIRILTSPKTYEQDMQNLIIEVKTRLHQIITTRRKEIEEEKAMKKAKKEAQKILDVEKE